MEWINYCNKIPEINQKIWFREISSNAKGISIFLGLDTFDLPVFRNTTNNRIVSMEIDFEWKPFCDQPERLNPETPNGDAIV